MPTSITFTDAIGAATLTNEKTAPLDRFTNWHHPKRPHGDAVHRQSDGRRTMFRNRDDFSCHLELHHIPSTKTGGVSKYEIAERLVYHLLNGGTCTVNTGDVDSNSYATCCLKRDGVADVSLMDAAMLEYKLTLDLLNIAASPAMMFCRYADQ